VKFDIRVVAATTSISELVKEGTFREDLFYRLNVVAFHCRRSDRAATTSRCIRAVLREKSCKSNDCAAADAQPGDPAGR